jgi:hypothetical protein
LDKQKNIYNKIIEENKKLDQKNYSGLAKIQSRIQKVGSIEKFLKTAKIPDLDQDVRPEVDVFETNSLAIKKAFDEYTEFFGEPKIIKTIGNIEIKVTGNKEPHILIMSKNGTLLGFVNGYNDGVNAILADELRGSGGIGKIALIEFFNRNPNKLTDVGGLTPNGKKAYVKMLESINTGYKEHTFTKDEINEINKKVNFADKKSKLNPMSKEDIPIDRNKSITIKYPGSSSFVVKPGTVWQDTFDEKKVYIKGINDKYVFLRHEDGSNEMQDIKTFRNRTIKALERVR